MNLRLIAAAVFAAVAGTFATAASGAYVFAQPTWQQVKSKQDKLVLAPVGTLMEFHGGIVGRVTHSTVDRVDWQSVKRADWMYIKGTAWLHVERIVLPGEPGYEALNRRYDDQQQFN